VTARALATNTVAGKYLDAPAGEKEEGPGEVDRRGLVASQRPWGVQIEATPNYTALHHGLSLWLVLILSLPKIPSGPRFAADRRIMGQMLTLLHSLGMFLIDLFKPRRRLVAENLFLRHQLSIALRRAPPRLRLSGSDRAMLAWMTRLWPSLLGVVQVVEPETILRWHRAGFRAFWRWKSRKRVGRPRIDEGLRDLIQQMSRQNPTWGAPRIHGELLMLGFEVAQSTVSKYMPQGTGPRSQGWNTFLRNQAQANRLRPQGCDRPRSAAA
jgi:hypothetical protein